jgi:hypothetical protein
MDSTQVTTGQIAQVFGMSPLMFAVISFLITAMTAWIKQNVSKITGWWVLAAPFLIGQGFSWLLPGPLTIFTRLRIGILCVVGATAIWGLFQGVMSEYMKTKTVTGGTNVTDNN